MEYFAKKRRFAAVVSQFKGKNVKAKQSKEAALKKVCQVTLNVPLTKAIKELLPQEIVNVLCKDTETRKENKDWAVNSIDPSFETTSTLRFFPHGSFAKDAKAEIESDGGVKVAVKKFFVRDGDEFMQLQVTMGYFKALWMWGGDVFGDANIVVELAPFQGEIEFDKADKKEEPEAVEA